MNDKYKDFKVRRMTRNGNWSIRSNSSHYLHSDGNIYFRCGEYWPTEKMAEEVLRKLKLEKNEMIKENDIVTISDFSYSAYVTKDGLKNNGNCAPNARQRFKVLRIGKEDVQVFTYDLTFYCRRIADTVLIGLKDGVVWFAWSGGLRLAIHTITIDGKDVEISHESFENLKKQLT